MIRLNYVLSLPTLSQISEHLRMPERCDDHYSTGCHCDEINRIPKYSTIFYLL